MEKRKLVLDREVLTASMLPPDQRTDGGTDPTSIWSIIISLLSIVTLPPKTDPSDESE